MVGVLRAKEGDVGDRRKERNRKRSMLAELTGGADPVHWTEGDAPRHGSSEIQGPVLYPAISLVAKEQCAYGEQKTHEVVAH